MVPWFDPRRFICQKCGHEFTGWLAQNVAGKVFTAQMKSTFCPKCGANYKNVSMKLEPDPPRPDFRFPELPEDEKE